MDLYEAAMKDAFEIKVKGKLGYEDGDLREMRVLNRILRVVDEGLKYEPDPRHVELLIRALDLEGGKPSAAPGSKPTYEQVKDSPEPDDTYADMIAAFRQHRRATTKIRFQEPDVVHVPNLSLRRSLLFTGPIGSNQFVDIDVSSHDVFTGLPLDELRAVRAEAWQPDHNARRQQLQRVLLEGPCWEKSTTELVAALGQRKKFAKKRVGARAARIAEKLVNPSEVLVGDDATSYRALAARANYLALDRPDMSFASKELCRCFASPTRSAVWLPKKLVRKLLGCPRLVWCFYHQKSCNTLVGSVDTDFAGCLITRRSTSGGLARRGGHLIKHWSATQPTVSLSSAEAELGGAYARVRRSALVSSAQQKTSASIGACIWKQMLRPRWGFAGDAVWARCVILQPQTFGSKRNFVAVNSLRPVFLDLRIQRTY